jgi:hypothetical protein
LDLTSASVLHFGYLIFNYHYTKSDIFTGHDTFALHPGIETKPTNNYPKYFKGAILTFIGSLIKCFAVEPELFAVLMLGQVFCAIAQTFTLSVPSRLAALWFGSNEVALATSIGVLGNQLGLAIGFLIPPNVAKLGGTNEMKTQFYYLYIAVSVFSFLTILLTLICKLIPAISLVGFELKCSCFESCIG